jgi:lysophospholipase L1-like esterase
MMKLRALLIGLCCLIICAAAVSAQQTPASPNRWEADIKKFEEADRQNPPAKSAVVFVGSSSIRMWKDLAEDFPDTKVINRGFGGSQLADSTYYADRIVIPYQPRMVVLYAGDNDLAAGKTPQQVFEDYKAFVSRVREKLPNAKIAFISIKPSLARVKLMEQMRATNELIRGYAAAGKNLVFIDVFPPMLNQAGQPRPELFIQDGLHMNREGYDIWRKVVAPYLH